MALQFAARQSSRILRTSTRTLRSSDISISLNAFSSRIAPRMASARALHVSTRRYGGLMPDTSDPPPRQAEEHDTPTAAAELGFEEYHHLADQYLERLLGRLEAKQEERPDIDAEYSAGVLTIETQNKGTIVINKQPPNRQIWLASPISGPLRFDWVVRGESMHEKEGAGLGAWVYLRDGTTLDSLLKKELGVDMEQSDLEPEAKVVGKGGI